MTAGTIITNTIRRTSGKSIATVTISRPSKLNALNSHLLNLLAQEIRSIPENYSDLIAIVLTGHGHKAFVGGLTSCRPRFITRVHATSKNINGCPIPVIGRMNRYALGAGLEIAASCDFRVASRNAVFGMPEVNVGIPSVFEAALLPGLIGWGRTRRLLMLGENISAIEALQWGLTEKVVEASGPGAVRRQKKVIRQWQQLGLDKAIEAGIPAFGESFEDGAEGPQMLSEFLKRKQKL
ncbi:ClpP/crotonase-like domain-containing protein [Aspergillus undulatus]|uniref:ClpP/crotonase-like domain-containing protein n=1 Tax=Aspergillus undulatus TaxID=1810928 RepID=UPI003CCDAD20